MTLRSFGARGVDDYRVFTAPVQRARSGIADATLDNGYDFVLMHDDDLIVGPGDTSDAWAKHGNPVDAWHQIMKADPTVGVIGAVYMRERPMMPNVVIQHPRFPVEQCHAIAGFPDAPFECAGVATGFMLVRAEVFRAIYAMEEPEGRPPMFRFPIETTEWGMAVETGEDYDFCRRARAAGFQVLADPRYRTVHLKDRGPVAYDREAWESIWERFDLEHPVVKELQQNCPNTFLFENVNGFLMLDHTPERERIGKAWQERQARKAA